ncbi:ATP-dependent DNA helicase RecG [Nocardia amikacinitolerans]|uniref:ATP-binding protein n=1 Tax=Nocardia amikacinitolerans TaxID=756689 RepID=UPI000AEF41AC|nr:ATP-binding protein [Nocardia amikacinitolerans]MCP2321075.1 ATP-dependent DNA helicase RecG [Nocardia amikacinitolerans]
MQIDLANLIETLRSTGGDCTDVEVKSCAGGLPQSLTTTLSALANHPGGGTVILGLEEQNNFSPVQLPNYQELKQGLAKKARSLTPPVQLTIEDAQVDHSPVIVAQVHECSPSAKPCRVQATGYAYLRGYDGDFQMSAVEEQAFLALRQPSLFDRRPVEGAARSDLDDELIEDFTRNVRSRDRRGLGRFVGDELLKRAGAITSDGTPTVAGLLSLGTHPQQWLPRFVIQAAAEATATDPAGSRVRNQVTITGPIPRMLDAAMEWAEQTFDTAVVTRRDGTVIDVPAYPLVAFRELIANALLHRDLDHWSSGTAVEVRLRRDRLVVTNPGGLHGITLDRLGKDVVTSARNMWLVNICQYLRAPDSGGRVIEALATGIPTIAQSLEEAGLPPACYADGGIRFTAVLKSKPQRPQQAALREALRENWSSGPGLVRPESIRLRSRTQQQILELLERGPRTMSDLRAALGLSTSGIRKALTALRAAGDIERIGGPGRATVYQLPDRQQD